MCDALSRCRGTRHREKDLFERRLPLDVLDFRRRQQLLQLVEFSVHEDAPLMQNRDAVSLLLGLFEILRGEQHGRAARGELSHRLPDLESRLRVKPRGRLVEKHDGRVADEAHRDI